MAIEQHARQVREIKATRAWGGKMFIYVSWHNTTTRNLSDWEGLHDMISVVLKSQGVYTIAWKDSWVAADAQRL